MITNGSCFDFDRSVECRDTASMKWDKYKGKDIIPLWVDWLYSFYPYADTVCYSI
ncbi:MAG: hypothetical protein V3V39_08050 [Desulfobacterales bacterium]|jgi:hypothetical protein